MWHDGYQFMGRKTQHDWRQVGKFFELPFGPCEGGVRRNESELGKAANALGFENIPLPGQEVVARKDIRTASTFARQEIRTCRSPVRRPPKPSKCAVQKPPGQHAPGRTSAAGTRCSGGRLHMLCHTTAANLRLRAPRAHW